MKWLLLGFSGILEIVWAVSFKYSHGFTVLPATIIAVITYIASAVFLSLALRWLPLGTAYAIWVGIGIIGTSVLGVALFGERLTVSHILCIAIILCGVIGLKLLEG